MKGLPPVSKFWSESRVDAETFPRSPVLDGERC